MTRDDDLCAVCDHIRSVHVQLACDHEFEPSAPGSPTEYLAQVFDDLLAGEMLGDVVAAFDAAVDRYVRAADGDAPGALAEECRAAMRPASRLRATIEAFA
jgi:hypothetical protein